MKLTPGILGPKRGRWRYVVLTFWYSFLFSSALIYFTHFHNSAQKKSPSLLHSLRSNSLRQLFAERDYLSLDSLQKKFTGLSISRVFRAVVGDEVSPAYIEDLVISGNADDVNKLLENETFMSNNGEVEVKLIEKVNVPVTATVDATTLDYFNSNATVKPTPPPPVPGYERIDTGEVLHLHCSFCAVVASSGHLLNSSAGKEIDSYPCVIRMNSATTINFENDVGQKTDIRVIGFVNMNDLKNHSDWQDELLRNKTTRASKIIVPWLYSSKIDTENDIYYLIAKNFSIKYPKTQFYILTEEKMKKAEDIFKAEVGISRKEAKTWLTTGWMSMLFAIDVCDSIDVFGLAKDDHCLLHPNDTTPYHYYEPYDKTECSYYKVSEEKLHIGHKFITEKAVFERWANKYKISFLYPHWLANSSKINKTLETPFLKRYNEAKKKGHIRLASNGSRVIRRVVKRVIKKVIVRRKVPVKKPAR
ncbi:Alpha-N-acetylgalactosaminide alpha-2,6-sialyltransferase 5 [Holothuria leucospilota]|uniref:Alpha-N-acetylgalactosaminide alpha-2,6-sialyltransferase 5 n=1 Tax=Holothuria leucospilota TaxID=206669 RepID=A0A9Q1C9R0_HOLLE|nr:Alpha-N-acetylgalactosaminide alpha-2,6-sialyltransferase 5 [Holothuria leucospilota]